MKYLNNSDSLTVLVQDVMVRRGAFYTTEENKALRGLVKIGLFFPSGRDQRRAESSPACGG